MKEIVKFILSIFDFFTQRKIINALSKKIKDNKINVFLDVGSHKGEYISKKHFSIDKIYSFEPNPDIFEILKKNLVDQILNYLIMVFLIKKGMLVSIKYGDIIFINK